LKDFKYSENRTYRSPADRFLKLQASKPNKLSSPTAYFYGITIKIPPVGWIRPKGEDGVVPTAPSHHSKKKIIIYHTISDKM